jgi:hypothetical protein
LLSSIKFAVQRLDGSSRRCGYIDKIRDVVLRSEGCEECVAVGDTWTHLRACMTYGRVECCASSKNRHADQTGHPIARSKEPGEDWLWCYLDDAFVRAEVP